MKASKLIAVSVLCFIAALIAIGAAIAFTPLDGFDGMIFGLMGKEDTLYSPGYSDSAFGQIAIGMTEQEVLTLLGEPIERYRLTGEPLQDWSRAFLLRVCAGNTPAAPAIQTFECDLCTSRTEK